MWFWSDKCILETCHFLASLLDFKNLKNSWYIWQYISGWRFLNELKILRLVLGSVYLERFKSSMIFYKASLCSIALNFFSLFNSTKVKVYRIFSFRINIYVFRIYTECCPIICPMLWRFQLPPIYFPPFKGDFLAVREMLEWKDF